MRFHRARWLAQILLALLVTPARGADTPYSLGVVPQRSAVLTARYWNPILGYVARKTGATLELRMGRTPSEFNAAAARGEYDFVYSLTIFEPAILAQGYRVIARSRGGPVTGQIATLEGSPVRSLADLEGKPVGFPSRGGFVGYALPMDHLLRQGITVTPVFGGNQEGIIGQLQSGKVVAIGAHSTVLRNFALREKLAYRVLWTSPPYYEMPIGAHPRVPEKVVAAVRRALTGMHADPEGARILAASAAVLQQPAPYGFVSAEQKDYRNCIDFYRTTRVRDLE